jgi:hypothetical protein
MSSELAAELLSTRPRQDSPVGPSHGTGNHSRRGQRRSRKHRGLMRSVAPGLLLELHGVGVGLLALARSSSPLATLPSASIASLRSPCCAASRASRLAGARPTGQSRRRRSGDRAENSALNIIAIVRMRHQPSRRAYVASQTAERRHRKSIIRCRKRFSACEISHDLPPGPSPIRHQQRSETLICHRSHRIGTEELHRTLDRFLIDDIGLFKQVRSEMDGSSNVRPPRRP